MVENRGSDGEQGGDGVVEASTDNGGPSTDSVEGANAEALPPESAREGQSTISAPIGRDGPPPSPAASTTTWSLFGDGKGESDTGVYDGGVAEAGYGDGAVVVFQLLMQRWELRPWVAAPRTLVASKEQVRWGTVRDRRGPRGFVVELGRRYVKIVWRSSVARCRPIVCSRLCGVCDMVFSTHTVFCSRITTELLAFPRWLSCSGSGLIPCTSALYRDS